MVVLFSSDSLNNISKSISLFDAITIFLSALEIVKSAIIYNCFITFGFKIHNTIQEEISVEEDKPIAKFLTFISIDDDISVGKSDSDIKQKIIKLTIFF